jgi:hypothetical protein
MMRLAKKLRTIIYVHFFLYKFSDQDKARKNLIYTQESLALHDSAI